MIEPDGFLVLGAAETVVGLSAGFNPYPERRGLYHPASGVEDGFATDCTKGGGHPPRAGGALAGWAAGSGR